MCIHAMHELLPISEGWTVQNWAFKTGVEATASLVIRQIRQSCRSNGDDGRAEGVVHPYPTF